MRSCGITHPCQREINGNTCMRMTTRLNQPITAFVGSADGSEDRSMSIDALKAENLNLKEQCRLLAKAADRTKTLEAMYEDDVNKLTALYTERLKAMQERTDALKSSYLALKDLFNTTLNESEQIRIKYEDSLMVIRENSRIDHLRTERLERMTTALAHAEERIALERSENDRLRAETGMTINGIGRYIDEDPDHHSYVASSVDEI